MMFIAEVCVMSPQLHDFAFCTIQLEQNSVTPVLKVMQFLLYDTLNPPLNCPFGGT